MNQFKVWLGSDNSGKISAYRTEYIFALSPTIHKSVRGRITGAFPDYGTFQWTTAVRGLLVLLLRSKASFISNSGKIDYVLQGHNGSLASSLDFAISKEPEWLSDMFGTDKIGRLNIHKLILRSNAHRKLHGPVCLALNRHNVSCDKISVYLNEVEQSSLDSITNIANVIESSVVNKQATAGSNKKFDSHQLLVNAA